jgi:hypothetical protein
MLQLVAAVPSDYLTTDGLVVCHHRGDAANLLVDNSSYMVCACFLKISLAVSK